MTKNESSIVADLAKRIGDFEQNAHSLFAKSEDSPKRIITLSQSRNKLVGLSILQDQLFEQSFKCIEHGIFRAAHVMAWAAFMDYVEERLSENNLKAVHEVRPKWEKHKTIIELRENIKEFQLIDVAVVLSLLRNSEAKVIRGYLAKRNECAHPGDYHPELNETLGYVHELIKRISSIQIRSITLLSK